MSDESGRRLRDRILPPVASFLGPAAVLGLGCTWKVRRRGRDPFQERKKGAALRCIVTLWHDTLFPLAYVHRNEGATVLVSRHGDGELTVRVLRKLGFQVARGSTTRGGAAGLRDLVRVARAQDCDLAITPDGPRGPARRAQPGVAYLSALTGFPILPLALRADRAWRFSSWDRFQIPKPGARVAVVAGALLAVPRAALEERIPEHLRAFEEEMRRAEGVASDLLAERW
ncbi:MAG: lysophospholipid acyltransferase family protein [Planctomycetes bacterium]|nr:lysophospholipid acyltransferase family protein [Planctomycetota bacterium]